MTTITALTNASDRSARQRPATADQAAGAATEAVAATPMTLEQYELQVARDTKRLAAVTGVATLVILVFFLGMMWLLSGYGPTV